jgi:hypothetical protein
MPSPRRSFLLIPAALAAFAIAGCDLGDDGPRTTQTRDVADFTRVENKASVDVRLEVGEPQRVRVRAGEEVIDDVSTTVRDGTLRVDFDHSGWGGNDVIVEATVPRLDGVEASGSGDIDAEGIGADAFEVRSDGSSDIALRGTTARLTVEIDGSGNADLGELEAQEADVKVSGSGDADVHAAERLDVDVDGSGDVRYHGNPKLTKSLDGSGDLSHVS